MPLLNDRNEFEKFNFVNNLYICQKVTKIIVFLRIILMFHSLNKLFYNNEFLSSLLLITN